MRPTILFTTITTLSLLLIHLTTGQDCSNISKLYKSKNLTYLSVGSELECTKQSPCCRYDQSFREIKQQLTTKWLKTKLNVATEQLTEKKQQFDTKFKEMMTQAHASFHAMFERTYGMLYIQHAHVFHKLFQTLESYYSDGAMSLESKLDDFFSILTRKMFQVLNAQYTFDEQYLSCAAQVIKDKQGVDLHKQIVTSLRRSFVASRGLSQGLQEGSNVVMGIGELHVNSTCLLDLTKLLECPMCTESRSYKPCIEECTQTTTHCLSNTLHMSKPWEQYINSLEQIIDRLLGPYNIEAVVEPIHIKISEIIMNFQENGVELSQGVFGKCGKPRLQQSGRSRRSPVAMPIKGAGGSGNNPRGGSGPSQEKTIDKLLREMKSKLKKMKQFFDTLPKQVCNSISKDYSSQSCWNGERAVRVNKDAAPSPPIPITGKLNDPIIMDELKKLNLLTEKLKQTFNGLDVEWGRRIDGNDFDGDMFEGSGSGSGDGDIDPDRENGPDEFPDGVIRSGHGPTDAQGGFNIPSTRSPPRIHVDEEIDENVDGTLNLSTENNGIRNPVTAKSTTTTTTTIPPIIRVKTKGSSIATTRVTTTTRPTTTPRQTTLSPQPGNPHEPSTSKLKTLTTKTLAVIKLFSPVFMNIMERVLSF